MKYVEQNYTSIANLIKFSVTSCHIYYFTIDELCHSVTTIRLNIPTILIPNQSGTLSLS